MTDFTREHIVKTLFLHAAAFQDGDVGDEENAMSELFNQAAHMLKEEGAAAEKITEIHWWCGRDDMFAANILPHIIEVCDLVVGRQKAGVQKTHKQLETLLTPELQKWAGMIGKELPEGWGFGLLVFPFDEDEPAQSVLWVSSGVRESMIDPVETLVEKWKAELGPAVTNDIATDRVEYPIDGWTAPQCVPINGGQRYECSECGNELGQDVQEGGIGMECWSCGHEWWEFEYIPPTVESGHKS